MLCSGCELMVSYRIIIIGTKLSTFTIHVQSQVQWAKKSEEEPSFQATADSHGLCQSVRSFFSVSRRTVAEAGCSNGDVERLRLRTVRRVLRDSDNSSTDGIPGRQYTW